MGGKVGEEGLQLVYPGSRVCIIRQGPGDSSDKVPIDSSRTRSAIGLLEVIPEFLRIRKLMKEHGVGKGGVNGGNGLATKHFSGSFYISLRGRGRVGATSEVPGRLIGFRRDGEGELVLESLSPIGIVTGTLKTRKGGDGGHRGDWERHVKNTSKRMQGISIGFSNTS